MSYQRNSFSYQYNPTRVSPAHDGVHYAEDDAVDVGGHDAVFYEDDAPANVETKFEQEKEKEKVAEVKSEVKPAANKPEVVPSASDKHDTETRVTVQVVTS